MLRMLINGKTIYASTEEVTKAGTHYKVKVKFNTKAVPLEDRKTTVRKTRIANNSYNFEVYKNKIVCLNKGLFDGCRMQTVNARTRPSPA
jgi:hypothetical protein